MAAVNPLQKALEAISKVDLNGNGIPDWEEPAALEFAWLTLTFIARRLAPPGSLFRQAVEVGDAYRQHVAGQGSALEVTP